MAVEIRELHIRAVVGTDSQDNRPSQRQRGADGEEEREALIALCVERVLEILEKEEER
jgi:hypothetical protein